MNHIALLKSGVYLLSGPVSTHGAEIHPSPRECEVNTKCKPDQEDKSCYYMQAQHVLNNDITSSWDKAKLIELQNTQLQSRFTGLIQPIT